MLEWLVNVNALMLNKYIEFSFYVSRGLIQVLVNN